MSAPNSSIDICNLALDMIGQAAISDIDEKTVAARRCKLWYDHTRRAVLQSHYWNFAKAQIELALSATVAPLYGFTDAYALPNNYLKLMNIKDQLVSLQQTDYNVANGYLWLNNGGAAGVEITYIFDETNVTKFSELFVDLLSTVMARKMAYGFTQKNTVVTMLDEAIQILEIRATASDGQERPTAKRFTSKYIGARRSNSTGSGLAWS